MNITAQCRECSESFEIGDDEVQFLTRVSPRIGETAYPIPLPVHCPACRLRLRTMHRNEQNLYRRNSSVSGAPLISLYATGTPWSDAYKVCSYDEWWSDSWDALSFGRDFDFSRPFFEQFHELDTSVPRVNLIQVANENCTYTTGTAYSKNCYLINCSENCDDCYYGKLLQDCRDVMDCAYAYESELLYDCFNVKKCYNCVGVSYSQNSTDCAFSENLNSCRSCFLCTDLYNKEFYVRNKPVTKEYYQALIAKVLGSQSEFDSARKELAQMRETRINKYANIVNCENSTGDFLTNCKNCTECYDVNDSEDCKYVTVGVNVKDLMDCSNMYLKPELSYQVLGTIGVYNVIFSLYVFNSQNVMYSQFCYNCKNLFGCSGLRNKEYCIFNKQYTKEEYEALVPRIIEQMMKNSGAQNSPEWGRFFPASTSPFGYNETVAQEYLPLTREEALARGYYWKEPTSVESVPQTYVTADSIFDVKDDILNEILACRQTPIEPPRLAGGKQGEHRGSACGKNYKIFAQELNRLRGMKLPVPRTCPDCRHLARMALRNPRKLWSRACSACGAAVQSTYPESSPQKIYCEVCYQKAIY